MNKQNKENLVGRLTALRGHNPQPGPALYDRLGYANELMDDLGWVAEQGSLKAAYCYLTAEFFADIGLVASLETLLLLRKTFSQKEWQSHHWSVRELYALLKLREQEERRKRRRT
jgi:hypothetical protein